MATASEKETIQNRLNDINHELSTEPSYSKTRKKPLIIEKRTLEWVQLILNGHIEPE